MRLPLIASCDNARRAVSFTSAMPSGVRICLRNTNSAPHAAFLWGKRFLRDHALAGGVPVGEPLTACARNSTITTRFIEERHCYGWRRASARGERLDPGTYLRPRSVNAGPKSDTSAG